MRSFWIHLRIRANACVRSPEAWLILTVFGLTTAVFWPAVGGASDPLKDQYQGLSLLLTWFLWFWLWLAPPMVWIRGRATTGKGEAPLGIGPAPFIPVGRRTRAVAEAVLALTVLGAVRWTLVLFVQGEWSFQDPWSFQGTRGTIAGAFFLLPMAVAWALPVRKSGTFMLRPILIAILAAVLHHLGGFFATWLGMVVGGLSLTGVALLIADLEIPEIQTIKGSGRAEDRCRSGSGPRRQLAQDAWLPVLKTWGPWVSVGIVTYGVCLYLDVKGDSWAWILFGGFEVFLIITIQPLFRPFNSNLLAESMVGKNQISLGDFMQVWSVLPVGRETVLRKVWLHGLLGGLILWTVPVAVLVVRHRILEGVWSLRGGIGGLMQFVVVGGLLVPVMASLMVAVAVGRKLEYAMSGLSLILGVHVLFLVKVLLHEFFGRGSIAAEAGPIVMLVILIAVGAIPPLRFLHKAPEPQ